EVAQVEERQTLNAAQHGGEDAAALLVGGRECTRDLTKSALGLTLPQMAFGDLRVDLDHGRPVPDGTELRPAVLVEAKRLVAPPGASGHPGELLFERGDPRPIAGRRPHPQRG